MLKKAKIISLITAVCVAASIIVGCGKSNDSKTIVIWSHLSDKEVNAIRKSAEEWSKQSGYKVKVHSDKGDNKAYIEAIRHNMGPDIEFGVSHSKLEKLYSEEMLAEVPEDKINKEDFLDSAVKTVSFDGKLYGLPISMATYAIYYNTDIIKNPPKTFEELIEQSKKYGFEYEITNIYFDYSIIGAYGGYVFKENNGKYDVHDIGLGNEGAIKGYAMIQDMVKKYKLMPTNVESKTARKSFMDGKIGFYFAGPWDIEEIKDSKDSKVGDKFSIMPLPTIEGKVMPSFVSVQVAYVNNKSAKKDKAWELLNYLEHNVQMNLFDITGAIPTLKSDMNNPKIRNNNLINPFIEQATKGGVAIPNISETQALQDTNEPLKMLIEGQITPEECGEKMIKVIDDFMEKQIQREKISKK